MKRVLIIAAHPDDEIIGCGGTIAKHTSNGDEVYTCIICEGTTGRFNNKFYVTPEERTIDIASEMKKREDAAINSAKLLGVKEVKLMNLPNLEIHLTSPLKVNYILEQYIEKINPDTVYIHTDKDVNIDHVSAYNSAIIATRNVGEVISFEIAGSTMNSFIPNLYVDITGTFQKKKEALEFYIEEMKEYPQPRSLEGIEILAKYRGINAHMIMAEAFDIIRKSQ